jgi:hypothetical protein
MREEIRIRIRIRITKGKFEREKCEMRPSRNIFPEIRRELLRRPSRLYFEGT